jgi:hypothetical protein
MLSTVFENICTALGWFVQSWNAVDSVGKHLYRVGMLPIELEYLCTGLECFPQSWNAFVSVGIPLYTVGML